VVVVETVPIPEPNVGEARIKIIQGGICATDVELTRGYECVRSSPFRRAAKRALSARPRPQRHAGRVIAAGAHQRCAVAGTRAAR
jgi:threonine dehydrogenase-like Zn-dependent dehydrogenase